MRALVVVALSSIALSSGVARAQDTAPGVEAQADSIEERMRTLRDDTWDLDSRIGETYRHLAAIDLSMRGGPGGARVSITQRNHAGPFYRLVEATYAIDGASVYHERDDSGALGAHDVSIHDGSLAPGAHVLSVVLRYEGEAGDVIQYVRGYHFVVRSSHTFVVPEGERMTLGVDTYAHPPDRAYTERLDVGYHEQLEEMR